MKNIKLDINTHRENLGGQVDDDEWSRDSTSTDVYIGDMFEITKGWSELESDIDFQKDKDYYLVWATYTTGDSFGRDSGNYEIIELFDSIDKAELMSKTIEDNYKVYEKESNTFNADYTVELTMNNGNVVRLCCPWKGYFESLECVNITNMRLR